LLEKQDWQGAREHCQKATELDPQFTFARQNQRRAERELDPQFVAMLAGEAEPASAEQFLALAEMCYARHRQWFARSAHFFKQALAADPGLIAGQRYNAACAAALASSGQGKDAPLPDESQRASLRKQALDWLTAELAVARDAIAGVPNARPVYLKHWQHDPDLAGVRDPAALDKLTAEEQADWRQLWTQVADLVSRQEQSQSKAP
jgi:serine/threonine-protein kinase